MRTVDVIVVGYGPTGLVLASLLGQRGHQVAVVERWPNLYGKPRLTHIDGETARLVSVTADGDHALREAWTNRHYRWVNAKGQLLMDIGQESGNSRRMLWDDHMTVHQPHIEEAIHDRAASFANVHFYRGYEATALQQDAGTVQLTCRPTHHGQEAAAGDTGQVVLRAPYLVGADGSKSFVRQSLGVPRLDFGFNERWLCVDTQPLRPLPAKFDENALQVCDPRRGYMFIPIGRKRQRFEFALLPGESTEEMQTPEAAFRMLEAYHGLGRQDVELIRNLVYTFECRLAERWRVGRVFLAGDAAHTNPPYLGQGACSGMRDAANLSWKLDLVLRGHADDALLDSYEVERLPHAKQLMLDARALGLVANTSNPVKAAIRDLMFRFDLAPKPKFPVLTDGVLARDARGELMGEAGTLPAQGRLTSNGRTMRFDDHVGFNFALVCRHDTLRALPTALMMALETMGVRFVELALTATGGEESQVIDADGVYERALLALGADAMLIRPDFVLYGHAVRADLARLVEDFTRGLRQRPTADAVQFVPMWW